MALTAPEVYEHLGRAVAYGAKSDGDITVEELAKLAASLNDYRKNSNFGTQAERNEAMKKVMRAMWKLKTGEDLTADKPTRAHTTLQEYGFFEGERAIREHLRQHKATESVGRPTQPAQSVSGRGSVATKTHPGITEHTGTKRGASNI